jgi:hypothetical protein
LRALLIDSELSGCSIRRILLMQLKRDADLEKPLFGSAQEFDGVRILGRFRQIVIFQPDCRHALAFSSR